MTGGKTYEYEETLHELEDGGAYVIFPYDLRKETGRGRMKVHALFDGIPYEGSVVNMGLKHADGSVCWLIGVRRDIRRQLNKKDGDRIRVVIRERS